MIFSLQRSILALCFLALGVANGQMCEGDHEFLSQNEQLEIQLQCWPQDPDTYYRFKFLSSTGPYADHDKAYGWCVDKDRFVSCNSIYTVDTYSIYDDIPDGAVDKKENLDLVNWLINHHPIDSEVDIANCTDGAVELEFHEYQDAIWDLIEDIHVRHADTIDCITDWLVEQALEYGDGYEPSCEEPDSKIGVLLVIDDADETITNQVLLAEMTLSSIEGICDCDPTITGDPHIRTWSGIMYDFHGVCDLVLVQNPDFENGLGLDIHVRTKELKQFSYVSSAALRIGNDVLEVMGDDHANAYWINKQGYRNVENGIIGSISGYPVSHEKVNSKQSKFTVDLGDDKAIIMTTFKKIVRVDIAGATKESFGSSLGLLGSYGSGKMIARDHITVLDDANAFGEEWQVLSSEEKLFHSLEGPQAPERCTIPLASSLRRRLVESNISEEEAKIACSRVASKDFDMCVFDVMATGDKDAVGAY